MKKAFFVPLWLVLSAQAAVGVISLPAFPSDIDWGLRLTYAGPAAPRTPAR